MYFLNIINNKVYPKNIFLPGTVHYLYNSTKFLSGEPST